MDPQGYTSRFFFKNCVGHSPAFFQSSWSFESSRAVDPQGGHGLLPLREKTPEVRSRVSYFGGAVDPCGPPWTPPWTPHEVVVDADLS